MSWLPISTVTGTSSAWIQRHAAANSRCRARIVRSPVIATACGRRSAISCWTQSSALLSSSPKWMSLRWKSRVSRAIALGRYQIDLGRRQRELGLGRGFGLLAVDQQPERVAFGAGKPHRADPAEYLVRPFAKVAPDERPGLLEVSARAVGIVGEHLDVLAAGLEAYQRIALVPAERRFGTADHLAGERLVDGRDGALRQLDNGRLAHRLAHAAPARAGAGQQPGVGIAGGAADHTGPANHGLAAGERGHHLFERPLAVQAVVEQVHRPAGEHQHRAAPSRKPADQTV